MCNALGIEKRHTTAYHPQADGMAERGIGTVKQTIRCLLLERKMDHGVWPSILPEVSFLLNSVTNASTNIAPNMLTFGRSPRVPTDIPSLNGSRKETTKDEYFQELSIRLEELIGTARTNRSKSTKASKVYYNKGKKDMGVRAGNSVFLKKEVRGCLDPKFESPYTVIRRDGEDVKISIPEKDRWVHLNRC